ncbi:MAG: alpha,alpha-trehalase TreF [Chitinophagaceae bacterium]
MSAVEIFDLNPLFEDVQMNRILPDGKTFVDCLPKYSLEEININYLRQKNIDGFNLKKFIADNFDLPIANTIAYNSDTSKPVAYNIESLWSILTRQPVETSGSLIPLPHPYIIPGGRFGEVYYWDSYFTMLGLKASGKYDMLENMVNNFSYLIDQVGYIPNGNRTYYIGRSQPPFYSLMVALLASIKGQQILADYLFQLENEYQFWMKGSTLLDSNNIAAHHSVRMQNGEILNRYWDENNTPRPESFREDVELSHPSSQDPKTLYRHLRAGAESGWDFSSRWFKDDKTFNTVHTTEIIPVDLNCLLFHLEQTIATAHQLKANNEASEKYKVLAEKRKIAIQKYCWNNELGFYMDYDWKQEQQKQSLSLAGVVPLFLNLADDKQANKTATLIKEKFLQEGGVVTTLITTGQQWDAPNGWAPLQWMTIMGLDNYNHKEIAEQIAHKWIKLNTDVFHRTGKLMEKYNVVDTKLEAGGGEYPGQDGFGWTNGVLLALIKKYGTAS